MFASRHNEHEQPANPAARDREVALEFRRDLQAQLDLTRILLKAARNDLAFWRTLFWITWSATFLVTLLFFLLRSHVHA